MRLMDEGVIETNHGQTVSVYCDKFVLFMTSNAAQEEIAEQYSRPLRDPLLVLKECEDAIRADFGCAAVHARADLRLPFAPITPELVTQFLKKLAADELSLLRGRMSPSQSIRLHPRFFEVNTPTREDCILLGAREPIRKARRVLRQWLRVIPDEGHIPAWIHYIHLVPAEPPSFWATEAPCHRDLGGCLKAATYPYSSFPCPEGQEHCDYLAAGELPGAFPEKEDFPHLHGPFPWPLPWSMPKAQVDSDDSDTSPL